MDDYASLRTVELAIESFKKPLSLVERSKRIRRNPAHLMALRYIRDCRRDGIEPSHLEALGIATGKIKRDL